MQILSYFLFSIASILSLITIPFSSPQNVIDNKSLSWSNEWQTKKVNNKMVKETVFSGSEVDFAFKGVRKFIITGSSTNKDDDTTVVVYLDKKSVIIPVKELIQGNTVESFQDSKKHTFRMVFYCRGWFSPCNFKLNDISIYSGEILPTPPQQPILGVLGDSISLLYARDNYTSLLAQDIHYQLHNASVWGRSLSHTGKIAPAIQRVSTDLYPYKPNLVIIPLGTNDILDSVREEDFLTDYKQLIEDIKSALPQSKIVVLGIMSGETHQLEQTTTLWNADIQRLLPTDVSYIDTTNLLSSKDYLDAIHPNPQGQKKLANFLTQYLVSHKLL